MPWRKFRTSKTSLNDIRQKSSATSYEWYVMTGKHRTSVRTRFYGPTVPLTGWTATRTIGPGCTRLRRTQRSTTFANAGTAIEPWRGWQTTNQPSTTTITSIDWAKINCYRRCTAPLTICHRNNVQLSHNGSSWVFRMERSQLGLIAPKRRRERTSIKRPRNSESDSRRSSGRWGYESTELR